MSPSSTFSCLAAAAAPSSQHDLTRAPSLHHGTPVQQQSLHRRRHRDQAASAHLGQLLSASGYSGSDQDKLQWHLHHQLHPEICLAGVMAALSTNGYNTWDLAEGASEKVLKNQSHCVWVKSYLGQLLLASGCSRRAWDGAFQVDRPKAQ